MAERTQTLASHTRWVPVYHFFAVPVLLVNAVVAAMYFYKAPSGVNAWSVVVAIALAVVGLTSRTMPLRAQDRIIRLEERQRLERLLPPDTRSRVGELSESQLIALRFAPDDEVPELTRRTLAGELKTSADIKRAIKNWRADHFRV